MTSFHPDYFFDLEHFRHKNLFSAVIDVWDVFQKIDEYFKTLILGKIEGEISEKAYLINPEQISIGKGTVVEAGAYIKGPCVIGENCTVRHGAYLRGSVIAGDRSVLGHDSEFKSAVLLNDCHAAHFAYVGNSILGNSVNLGAGAICANLRFDKSMISIHSEENSIPTGLRKLGAIIGDYSQLGCHAVANPGSLLGKHVLWYPCVNYGGFIPSESIVRQETNVMISRSHKS